MDHRRVPASLIRFDRTLDLALLKVEADPKLVPLTLGGDEKLRHTAEIVTFGFPFGQFNAAKPGDFPDITVLHSRITSLPREGGRLRYIQFDNQLNPGNSGGPVLDETGRVIGVAVKSIQGAAMNRAIPVSLLTSFLAPPALIFNTPVPGHGDRWKPTTWVVEVLTTDPAAKPMEGLSVKLTLRAPSGSSRTIDTVSGGDGLFKATVTPLPLDPNRKLRLTVHGDGGVTRDVEVLDLPIKVGGRELLLGDIERLDVRAGGAKLVYGPDAIPGPIKGLELLRAADGQKPVENLVNAVSIDVTETVSSTPVRSLEVVAELKQAGKVLSTARRTIYLEYPAGAALVRTPSAPAVPPNSRVFQDGAGRTVVVTRVPTRGSPEDEAMVSVGGRLDVQGVPRQAGRDLSATRARIGEAEVANELPPIPRAPAIHVVNGLPEGVVAVPSGNVHLYSVGFSPDGKTFGIGGDDDRIRLVDPETGEVLRSLKQESWVQGLTFSGDGKSILAGIYNQRTVLWNLKDGKPSNPLPDEGLRTNLVRGVPGGKRAIVGYLDDEKGETEAVRLWDLERGKALLTLPIPGKVLMTSASQDGSSVVLLTQERPQQVPENLKPQVPQTVMPRASRVVAPQPPKKPPGLLIRRINATTGAITSTFDFQEDKPPLASMVSSDGMVVAVATSKSQVLLFGPKPGDVRRVDLVEGRDSPTLGAAFSDDGRKLATRHGDKSIRIWDVADGHLITKVNLRFDPGILAFSPDGLKVGFGTFRGLAGIWTLPRKSTTPQGGSSAPTERLVNGKIRDVVSGGGGRYLVLLLAQPARVSVFDAQAGEVVKTIPLASENALVAAGASRFVVAYPDDRIIHQFAFAGFARVSGPSQSPIRGAVKALSMGDDSEGPLLVGWAPTGGQGLASIEPIRFTFVDLGSMKALKVGNLSAAGFQQIASVAPGGGSFTLHPFLSTQFSVHARSSSDGSLVGFWKNGWGGDFYTLALRGDEGRSFDGTNGAGYLVPGPDNTTIFTGVRGRRTADASPIGQVINGNDNILGSAGIPLTFPSNDPALYFGVVLPPGPLRNETARRTHTAASIHQANDGRRLLVVTGLDEMDDVDLKSVHDQMTVDRRFRYLPAAQLLVTIPPSDDRLMLRRLDLDAALGVLGVPYLYGSSPTRIEAKPGKPLAYQATARSKAGALTWLLEKGPEGMVITADGKLTWLSPKSIDAGQPILAILSVSDGAGNQVFHRLEIFVR